jgi:hypothetical protein
MDDDRTLTEEEDTEEAFAKFKALQDFQVPPENKCPVGQVINAKDAQ